MSDLAGGNKIDDQYHAYVTDQAKENLKAIVSLNVLEKSGFPQEAAESLEQQLSIRRAEILQAIEQGEVSLDAAISIATEQTLLKCLMSIAISANTEMLPVLHPGYHSHSFPRLQKKCQETVQELRANRSTT